MFEDITNVVIYARYSSNNQTEQSIEGQLRVCREFCKRHDMNVVDTYIDRATSASKHIEKRIDFLKMIKDAEKQNFEAVIVYKLDRFSRSRYDMATYKYRLRKYGVQLISATENISQDPEGIILESVLEGMAEFYSAELSQKINRGLKETAYKHNYIGGTIPLGYKLSDKKLVIDPETAPVVQEIFLKYAKGVSITEICRSLNARGIKNTKGTQFGKSSFTKMFRNEKYIGVYQYKDYRAENVIPPIIDKKLWDKVQLRLGQSKSSTPGSKKAIEPYLLSGKCFCGHCGSHMNGEGHRARTIRYYRCYGAKNLNKSCTKKVVRKDTLEYLVTKDAMSLLTDDRIEEIAEIAIRENAHTIEVNTNIPDIKNKLHETQVSLSNIMKAIETGAAPDTLVKRMVELEKEKKALEKELKDESRNITDLDKYQIIYWLEQFKNGDIEDPEFRRHIIDLFVNSVTVYDIDDPNHPKGGNKVVITYNLTSTPSKTYRLDNTQDGMLDLTSNVVVSSLNPTCLLVRSLITFQYNWDLVSPEGMHYHVYNLTQWVYDNIHLFGDIDPLKVIHSLTVLRHDLKKGQMRTYHGWTVII